MRARTMLMVLVSAMMVAQVYPQVCEARGKKGAVKKKKKVKKPKPKDDADVSDNPYADEGDTGAEEAAAEEQPEAAAEAAEGEEPAGAGEQPAGEQGSFLPRGGGDQGTMRRSGRMEFDERLVKGQAAKSGAVYLFKRVPRRLPGLVPMRRSYRKRIVEPVLGERELKPAVYSEEPSEEPAAEAETETEGQAAEQPPEAEETEPKTDKKTEGGDDKG